MIKISENALNLITISYSNSDHDHDQNEDNDQNINNNNDHNLISKKKSFNENELQKINFSKLNTKNEILLSDHDRVLLMKKLIIEKIDQINLKIEKLISNFDFTYMENFFFHFDDHFFSFDYFNVFSLLKNEKNIKKNIEKNDNKNEDQKNDQKNNSNEENKIEISSKFSFQKLNEKINFNNKNNKNNKNKNKKIKIKKINKIINEIKEKIKTILIQTITRISDWKDSKKLAQLMSQISIDHLMIKLYYSFDILLFFDRSIDQMNFLLKNNLHYNYDHFLDEKNNFSSTEALNNSFDQINNNIDQNNDQNNDENEEEKWRKIFDEKNDRFYYANFSTVFFYFIFLILFLIYFYFLFYLFLF